MRFGPPPQILWLTCGNLTNRRLRTLLDEVLADALTLPATGVVVVECGDLAETVADRAAKGFGHGGVPHGPTGSKADRVRGGGDWYRQQRSGPEWGRDYVPPDHVGCT